MSSNPNIPRRDFLKMAMAGAVLQQMSGLRGATTSAVTTQPATTDGAMTGDLADLDRPDALRTFQQNVERNWLGQHFWGNRLQDWRLAGGKIECVSQDKGPDLRTAAILTREIAPGKTNGTVRATLGRISKKGKGFGGFLIGAGAGKLDWRAAALVQKSSGKNGGILCVCDTDGRTAFREHTNEKEPFAYAETLSKTTVGATKLADGDFDLVLEIKPGSAANTSNLELRAEQNSAVISTSVLDIEDAEIVGGVMLASASTSGPDGMRFRFHNIDTSGEKVAHRPERALGPVLGTLFSLNGSIMKLSAQLMPVGKPDPQEVELSVREGDSGQWRQVATQKIGRGYCATFRVDNWDDSKDWQYRVTYGDDGSGRGRPAHYAGVIRRDPRHERRQFAIGLHSCTAAAARSLDGGSGGRNRLPKGQPLLRYTPENIYFPYAEMVSASLHHNPDMLVFCGDQFYETSPTVKVRDDEDPLLDYLYKYYLWLWGFRDLTRDRPTLVLVDDHDVYHGNLWGNGGRKAPDNNQDLGGYERAAIWVNMVQQTQCGHNPDPWDPTPVDQGIGVYYCAFSYGGAEFCLLEDRKWKTAPVQGNSLNVHVAEMLGERQEKFIADWGRKVKDADARICLTATLPGCAQTSPEGLAVVDFDSNGYPPLARTHAVRLLREANVLMLAGDQHLGSVIRLGDETFTDGPIVFSGPAGSTSWTRWFQPAEPLPNAGDTPHTGDFQDGFNNKMRVLAVANPSITFKEFRKHVKGRSQGIGDRSVKSEGYGIVKVDLDARKYTLECWRWDVDPAAPGAKQYAGWPMAFGFDEVAKG